MTSQPVIPASSTSAGHLRILGQLQARGGLRTTASQPATPVPSTPPSVPEALRPWQDVFSRMPPEHLRILGQLMADLSLLIDEPQWAVPQSRGEFDSYDGIANRGEMERLLASEWVWRDLDAEEFLRRFAESELFYHRVHHRAPTETKAIGVIIDSGPWMLGRPRLVALAALLCLGRLAHRDNLRLVWRSNSLLASKTWNEGFGLDAVKRYLTEVSSTNLAEADIEQQMADPPESAQAPTQMRWYVIGPRQYDLDTERATQIAIVERPTFDREGQFVVEADVSLRTTRGRRRDVTLSYPREEAAAALLREPFVEPKVKKAASKRSANEQADEQSWALRHVAVLGGGTQALLKQPGGILVTDYDGASFFLPVRQHETLVGIRVDDTGLTTARLLAYADFSRLIVEQYPNFGTAKQLFELRLKNSEPLCQGEHRPHTLPLMARPGWKPIFWVYAPNGEAYEISRAGVRPYSMLKGTRVVKCMSDCVIVRRRNNLLSVRPMEGSQPLATFNVGLTHNDELDAQDVVFNPAEMLLAVKKEGDWKVYGKPLSPQSLSVEETFQLLHIYRQGSDSPRNRTTICCAGLGSGYLVYRAWSTGDRRFSCLRRRDRRFDLAVHSSGLLYPVYVQLDEYEFAKRLMYINEDDEERGGGDCDEADIADEMAEAKCLRP